MRLRQQIPLEQIVPRHRFFIGLIIFILDINNFDLLNFFQFLNISIYQVVVCYVRKTLHIMTIFDKKRLTTVPEKEKKTNNNPAESSVCAHKQHQVIKSFILTVYILFSLQAISLVVYPRNANVITARIFPTLI